MGDYRNKLILSGLILREKKKYCKEIPEEKNFLN